MKVSWARLGWVVFVCLYLGVFFWNFFLRFPSRFVPTLYLYILVIWLSAEFYLRQPFFQSGRLIVEDSKKQEKYDYLSFPLRSIFALFFYSCMALGVADFVWFKRCQINVLSPIINIVGIVILFVSVLVRLQADRLMLKRKYRIIRDGLYSTVRHPSYFATLLLVLSISFAFSSFLTLIYTVLVGLPVIYFEARQEDDFLAQKNGEDYLAYQRDTNLFIPGII